MRSAPHRSNKILIPSLDPEFCLREIGGGKGIRTPDLLIANETLYQLSYTPEVFRLPPLKVQNLGGVSTGGPPVLPPDDFRSVHSCPEKSRLNAVRIGSR